MFTGLIEEMGKISSVVSSKSGLRLTIEAPGVREELQIGDSVAVDGVCLTVVELDTASFSVDVVAETLKRTTISEVKPYQQVNLERPLRLDQRLGGHFVSGHVDGIGTIERKLREGNSWRLRIRAESALLQYVIEKGSIAVDGISLTVASQGDNYFEVALIPHTVQVTTLGVKTVGVQVNLEVDLIGKYVERFIKKYNEIKTRKITTAFLQEQGFM